MKRGLTIFSMILAFLLGCGGGGSSAPIGPAEVRLELSPNKIDSGDVTTVTVSVSDVETQGVALKIRYPEALGLVRNSSKLFVNGESRSFTPTENVVASGIRYLVYYIKPSTFAGERGGEVRIQLEGQSEVVAGLVEVDVDLDNPNIRNSQEFDVNNPQFTPVTDATIDVLG